MVEETEKFKIKVAIDHHGPPEIIKKVPRSVSIEKKLTQILPEADKWTPLVIYAGTGLGKTIGTEKVIFAPAIENWQKLSESERKKTPPLIVFVSSRAAINLQLKSRLIRLAGLDHLLDELTEEGLRKIDVIGPIRILTYHALWHAILEGDKTLAAASYLIVDEVHALALDATFVGFTGRLLEAIPNVFRDARRLYLSATPEPILPALRLVERPNYIEVYRWQSDFKAFQLHFYREYSEAAEYLKALPEGEKGLIFVPSIREGELVMSCLPKGSQLITARTKKTNPTLWGRLLSEQKLESRFTVTTLTLDAGVSLTDPQLKHIVCCGLDLASIAQQAGRKRLKAQERLSVYVWSPTRKQIGHRLERYRKLLEDLRGYPEGKAAFVDRFVLEDDCPELRSMCMVDAGGRVFPNWLAVEYLEKQAQYYEALLSQPDEWPMDTAVCKFFRQKMPKDTSRWLDGRYDVDHISELLAWLKSQAGCVMDKEAQTEFVAEFKVRYRKAYGARKNDRGDRTWGLSVSRQVLKDLGWGMSIESKGGIWKLVFTMEEAEKRTRADPVF